MTTLLSLILVQQKFISSVVFIQSTINSLVQHQILLILDIVLRQILISLPQMLVSRQQLH